MTDSRERMLDALLDATGEKTKSKAIDKAIAHYCACAGGNLANPDGTYTELMQLAESNGSVTAAEIAATLDTEQLPIDYTQEWSVNE